VATITMDMLRKCRACPIGMQDFEELFGESVEVTTENVEKVINSPLISYLGWLGLAFLNHAGYRAWSMESLSTHTGAQAGPDCPGCLESARKFVELYNQEEYRKTEAELGKEG